jgi:Zn-dependent oligopeptidase
MGNNIELELYDVPYYSRLYKEKNTQLDELELKKHFPLDVVTSGMFNIYQTLLGLKFNEITSAHHDKLWHEEVKLFEVTDSASSDIIGHFMLDLFPRDGKYGHELDPEVGMQYRKEILSYGDSRQSIDSLRIFLGREPNDQALNNQFH